MSNSIVMKSRSYSSKHTAAISFGCSAHSWQTKKDNVALVNLNGQLNTTNAEGNERRRPKRLEMIKTLDRAIAEVTALPDADQEEIGRQLLSHVEKLRRLREELDKGVRSLDAERGSTLDIEEFIRRKSK